jgi:hypothetical protein
LEKRSNREPWRGMRGQTLEPISDGARTEKVVEFFLELEAAEAMIREVRADEPLLAEDLRGGVGRARLGGRLGPRESFRVDQDLMD